MKPRIIAVCVYAHLLPVFLDQSTPFEAEYFCTCIRKLRFSPAAFSLKSYNKAFIQKNKVHMLALNHLLS